MAARTAKSDVVRVRIDAGTLALMDRARAHVHLDKSKFIRESVREKATTVLSEQQRTLFSEADWLAFFDRLSAPAEPTARMVKAAQKLKDLAC